MHGTQIVRMYHTRFSLSVEIEQANDAGRDGRTRLVRPNSQARTGTGKCSFPPVQLTTSRIGKPYSVDPYSATRDDHTSTSILGRGETDTQKTISPPPFLPP